MLRSALVLLTIISFEWAIGSVAAQTGASHSSQGAQDARVTDCDIYAAATSDPICITKGVSFGNLSANLAISACENVVRHHSNSLRLIAQLTAAELGSSAASNPVSQPNVTTLLANEKHWLEGYLAAKGGCANLGALSLIDNSMWAARSGLAQRNLNVDLFGKRLLKWSDEDIAMAGRLERACFAKNKASGKMEITRQFEPEVFEREVRKIVMQARDLDAQQKAKAAAQIEQDQLQLRRKREQAVEEAKQKQEQLSKQAQRDKEAAEEALRLAELEEPKVANATKAAEEARRARLAAEQRLADIKSRIEAQKEQAEDAVLSRK